MDSATKRRDRLARGLGLQAGRNRLLRPVPGRRPEGKLADEDVREIRRRYIEMGEAQANLARAYGINQSRVSRIVTGLDWTHVPYERVQ